MRRAIAAANNRIYEMARDADDLHGMACVLTLAVVDRASMVIGHVGDSRLYLIWNGSIRKLTSDHSPVGEGEDAGELTEEEAMLHPRRNEVFRDVGTRPHDAGDDGFIEIRRCHFKPDAAFLLCSDGLSDLLPSAAIRDIVERYDGDAGAGGARTGGGRQRGRRQATTSPRCWWRAANSAGARCRQMAYHRTRARGIHHAHADRPRRRRTGPVRRLLTGAGRFSVLRLLLGILLSGRAAPVRG